eukprot:11506214-Alexandrium_andersonii.AAC.1
MLRNEISIEPNRSTDPSATETEPTEPSTSLGAGPAEPGTQTGFLWTQCLCGPGPLRNGASCRTWPGEQNGALRNGCPAD